MRTVSFTLTPQDWIAAQRFHFRQYSLKSLLRIGLVLGAIHTVLWLVGEDRRLFDLASGLGTLAVALLAIGAVLYLLLPSRSRRLYAQTASMRRAMTISWSDWGVRFDAENGTWREAWSDFFRIADSRTSILLLVNDSMFYLVPKRALSPDQIADILGAARS